MAKSRADELVNFGCLAGKAHELTRLDIAVAIIRKLEARVTQAEHLTQVTRNQKAQLRENAREQIAKLEAKLAERDRRIERAESLLESEQRVCDRINAELDETRRRVRARDRKIDELERMMRSCDKACESALHASTDKLQKRIAVLEQEIATLRTTEDGRFVDGEPPLRHHASSVSGSRRQPGLVEDR